MKRLGRTLTFLFAFGTFLPMTASSAEPVTDGNATSESAAAPQQQFLFGVVGQVTRPGVYRAPIHDPFLADLLNNSGGLTKSASGYLRVIRPGPNGFQAVYADHSEVQLRPGDVVVAERNAPLPTTPSSPYVQLAFVNLIDRPVVLKMASGNATVGRILELLGQSSDLAGTVQIIPPANAPLPSLRNAQLPSGTVLVFDRSVLTIDRIPELPVAIVNETARPRTATVAGQAGHHHGMAHRFQFASTETQPGSNVEPQLDPQQDTLNSGNAGKMISQVQPPSKPREVSDRAFSIKATAGPLPPATTTDNLLTPPEIKASVASGTSWLGGWASISLAVVITAVAVWCILVLIRRQSTVGVASSGANSTSVPQTGDLNEIINDELPVVEESLSYPKQLQLFGRPAGAEKYRIDADQRPGRPHFVPGTVAAKKSPQPERATIQTEKVEPPAAGGNIRLDQGKTSGAHQRPAIIDGLVSDSDPSGLLGRVLSTVHGTAKR